MQEASITKAKDKEIADLKDEYESMKADLTKKNDSLKSELEKMHLLVE